MSSKSALRRRLPAVLAVAAVILASGATGAGAAKLVTSAQIKDNTIQSRDIRDGTVQSKDIKDATIQSRDLRAGSVRKANLDPSLRLGPVASGYAPRTGGPVIHAQGVPGVTVTWGTPGVACVRVPGVDSADHTMVVSADWGDDSTAAGGSTTVAESNSDGTACAAGDFNVRTYLHGTDGQTAYSTQGFAFIVN